MQRSITKSTTVVFILTTISSILGFVRESYIAFLFGATGLTDAFYIALIFPDTIVGLIQSALTYSLVPVLKAERRKDDKSASTLIYVILLLSMVIFTIMTIIAFLFRNPLVSLFSPGFSKREHLIAVQLLSVMIVGVVFTGISGVLSGVNNAFEEFTFPAAVGVVYNVILISTSIILAPVLGIRSLAFGFLIGVFGKLIIQFVPVIRYRYLSKRQSIWHPSVPTVARLMPPILISSGLGTINLIIDRVLASGLPNGYISDLTYASKIGLMPAILVGGSLATTLYNQFVSNILDNNFVQLQKNLVKATTWVVFISIVIGGIFILFSSDIIYLLFRHGAFTLKDVAITATPLIIYGVFQPFYILIPILDRVFYAAKKNRSVMMRSLLAVGVNILVSVLTVHRLGIKGLVLGNGLAQVVAVVMLCTAIFKWTRISYVRIMLQAFRRGGIPGILVFCSFGASLCITRTWGEGSLKLLVFQGMIALGFGVLFLTIYTFVDGKSDISIFLRKILGVKRIT
ncbi:murein biosynthesis integral membrane protein MurJ [Alicyclobacillus fodiniaquatilis]|uniref:Murein biosynthesis integral membrane protein MurJ n=1 Tax=Alicyclobacillus fodiniaquatilis TaxID=1661150 RepID=A0ABW4JQR0_9BACL